MKPCSPAEYIQEHGARRNPDKIVCLASFLGQERGQQEFSRDDIRPLFQQAGEKLPANYPRDFTWTIQNGWIAEVAGKPGEYYITRAGGEAVAQAFSDRVIRRTAGGVRPRRKKGEAARNEA